MNHAHYYATADMGCHIAVSYGIWLTRNWYKFMKKNQFQGFSDMKRSFNSVDKVGDFYVFDIGGNKLRLITSIHFNRQKIYIRYVLTHREYEKGHWKQKGK